MNGGAETEREGEMVGEREREEGREGGRERGVKIVVYLVGIVEVEGQIALRIKDSTNRRSFHMELL